MLYGTSLTAPVFGLRREIDRLFEDTFGGLGRGDGSRSSWAPAVDIQETDKEVSLIAELPGVSDKDVEVTADNGILTIRGEKNQERKEGEEGRYHLIERNYGSFSRSFQLPTGIDDSKIEADFENGVLKVRIPKAALPQPKKIRISAKSESKSHSNRAATQHTANNTNAQNAS